jgi:hypothetical protein
MNSAWPLLIGGYFPAFLWGLTAIFQKQSAQAATGPALYLIAERVQIWSRRTSRRSALRRSSIRTQAQIVVIEAQEVEGEILPPQPAKGQR